MENKSNQSGGQSNRNRSQNNRNRNRNRNNSGGQRNSNNNQRNSNKRNASSKHSNSNSNSNRNNSSNRNRSRNRSRKPKKVELTAGQKFLKAITFGAIDPNKNLNQQKQKPKQQQPQAKTKKPAQPMSENKGGAKPAQKKRSPKLHEVTSQRLYVGNLDYGAAEDDLEELFRGVGNVLSAEVVTNARTQQSKGFAFVEMGSIEEAKRAVEVLHDQDFMGRKLLVSGARSEGPRKSEETAEVA